MSVAEAVAELEGATVKPPTVEEARAALEANRMGHALKATFIF